MLKRTWMILQIRARADVRRNPVHFHPKDFVRVFLLYVSDMRPISPSSILLLNGFKITYLKNVKIVLFRVKILQANQDVILLIDQTKPYQNDMWRKKWSLFNSLKLKTKSDNIFTGCCIISNDWSEVTAYLMEPTYHQCTFKWTWMFLVNT